MTDGGNTEGVRRRYSVSRREFLKTIAAGGAAIGGVSALGSQLPGWTSLAGAATPKKGGDLTFARTADPQTIDPSAAIDTESIWTVLCLYDCLYDVTQDGHSEVPWLATGYELSKDQLTWTFHLRPGVKFSDGRPLDSTDVRYTLERALKGPNAYILSAVNAIDTPNASTVVLHTSHPWGPLAGDMSMYSNAILPNELRGATDAAFFAKPIGTGPFVMESWTKGQQMVLKANPHYWKAGQPYLNSVTFLTIPDDNTRLIQLKGGEVDIMEAPPYSSVAGLKGNPSIKVNLFKSTAVSSIVMSEKKPQFQDLHVRRAISYAVDRVSIIKDVLFGHGTPAASFFSPSWAYYNPDTPKLWYDVKKAKKELALSKYPKGFKTTFAVAAGDSLNGTIAQIVQANLKVIGIDVNIQSYDPSTLASLVSTGNYDMSPAIGTLDISDPDENVPAAVGEGYGGIFDAYTWYSNPELLKLVHQSENTISPAARTKIYNQIQTMTAEACPFVMLYYSPFPYAEQTTVKGFDLPPTGAYHLESVWLSQ
ncbi:MAG TPA: ABC transporter substrate-binding protein [Acidimicrobiales bacterium]|jgi:peptide/nickel transport system substrate-binding protein|nr:ABC transporter substrate-binding protein [Acidimicrobiales bacterium]